MPTVAKVDMAETPHALPVAQPVPMVNNGAIFQAAQYRPLFEDHRARLVGDTLTVQIVEKVSATQNSTSSIDKSGELSAGITALPRAVGQLVHPPAGVGGSSQHLLGQGRSTENSNDFSGTITATVTGVLPNGHLLIAGEKQIGVNATSTCCASPARSTRAPSSPATGRQRADRQRAHRAEAAAARRPTRRQVGWSSRFFERDADLTPRRMGHREHDAVSNAGAPVLPVGHGDAAVLIVGAGRQRRCGGPALVQRRPRARIKEVASVRAAQQPAGRLRPGGRGSTAPATRPRRRRSPPEHRRDAAADGVTVPAGANMQLKNVAAVMVTAHAAALRAAGQTIDVNVSSLATPRACAAAR